MDYNYTYARHINRILKNTVLASLRGVLEHATGTPLVNQAHVLHSHPLAHAGCCAADYLSAHRRCGERCASVTSLSIRETV